MNWNKKKVLITGAGGFIGSHLVEELLKRNCRIRAFVHYNSFNRWGWLDFLPDSLRQNIEIYNGDIRDPHGVKTAMKEVDVVFHLAALIGIPYSYHSPDVYVDTNIRGTLNVLQAGRDNGVERIIHTSTSEVYGTAQFVPITEEHPVNPQSPYAATKSGADFLAITFFRSFNTPVVIVRPFNTYGPRQSARAIIPTIITQLLSGEKRIKLGAVTPTRDMNYVKDTVIGFIRAAESDNVAGETINIGANREIAIGDLALKIAEVIGIKVEVTSSKERLRPLNSEVERLLADNSKAKRLLNWAPETSLEEGLKKTVEWFRKPGNLGFYKPDLYNI